jgi:hypothetical protein
MYGEGVLMKGKERERLTCEIRVVSDLIFERDKKNRTGSFEFVNLFSPDWGLLNHNSSFTVQEAIFLSLDINQDHCETLTERISNGTCNDTGAKEELFFLNMEFKNRLQYVRANMHLFGIGDDRVDREKFYKWAKTENIQIPDEFSIKNQVQITSKLRTKRQKQ